MRAFSSRAETYYFEFHQQSIRAETYYFEFHQRHMLHSPHASSPIAKGSILVQNKILICFNVIDAKKYICWHWGIQNSRAVYAPVALTLAGQAYDPHNTPPPSTFYSTNIACLFLTLNLSLFYFSELN